MRIRCLLAGMFLVRACDEAWMCSLSNLISLNTTNARMLTPEAQRTVHRRTYTFALVILFQTGVHQGRRDRLGCRRGGQVRQALHGPGNTQIWDLLD